MSKYVELFKANADQVHRLVEFDRKLLDYIEPLLEGLRDRLKNHHKMGFPQLTAETVINQIKVIRQNESLLPHYEKMFNQCVVLLVAYFTSSVGDLFRSGIIREIRSGSLTADLEKVQLKATIRELAETTEDAASRTADLLVDQLGDISFQDMQATLRSFEKYLGVVSSRDTVTDDIILGQASRHVIVHNLAQVDARMARQIAGAPLRTLKPSLAVGDAVQFTPAEIRTLSGSMITLIERTEKSLDEAFGS